MISFLYLNEERARSFFAQLSDSLRTKRTSEHSVGAEGRASGGFAGLIKGALGVNVGRRSSTEEIITSEQMVVQLIQRGKDEGFVHEVKKKASWKPVGRGALITFEGQFNFILKKEETSEIIKSGSLNNGPELWLKGEVGRKSVEIPFSREWVTGETCYYILYNEFGYNGPSFLEGLGSVMSDPHSPTLVVQPVAFGQGFNSHVAGV